MHSRFLDGSAWLILRWVAWAIVAPYLKIIGKRSHYSTTMSVKVPFYNIDTDSVFEIILSEEDAARAQNGKSCTFCIMKL